MSRTKHKDTLMARESTGSKLLGGEFAYNQMESMVRAASPGAALHIHYPHSNSLLHRPPRRARRKREQEEPLPSREEEELGSESSASEEEGGSAAEEELGVPLV